MMYKKTKEQILAEVYNATHEAVMGKMYQLQYNPVNSVTQTVADAVANGVEAGIKKYMESIYTDAEFEQDIGLS